MTPLYTLLAMAGIWFGVHTLYVVAMAAKDAIARDRLTVYWWVMLAPAAVLGVLLDFAFNYTFGWMFLKVPRRYLFSQTVQYHFSNSDGWRLDLARFFARQLNVFDEHIK